MATWIVDTRLYSARNQFNNCTLDNLTGSESLRNFAVGHIEPERDRVPWNTKKKKTGLPLRVLLERHDVGTQDVHHQAKACQKAEAKQTDSPMGEDEDWLKTLHIQRQEASLEENKVEVVNRELRRTLCY
ncbi:hypothetical protein X777_11863 [Ooceraea biroi]|uniref:Uncharacterized protein n=1 Tax=Ooceraea biroi TaxID=2015173 RepID=A0A026W025_OOCBI|nr:hypothetical protein X777_11863 [Ooceraea biroi]